MVMEVTGVQRQLTPEEQQIVGPEIQEPRVPDSVLPRIERPEKREAPLPSLPRAPLPPPAQREEEVARQTIYGQPILKVNRVVTGEKDWQMLVRWTIPELATGDLHEIALRSNNDEKTRYRIIFNGVDQRLPLDRQTSTPTNYPWRRNVLPPRSSVTVEVLSTDGTSITVDGSISGTER